MNSWKRYFGVLALGSALLAAPALAADGAHDKSPPADAQAAGCSEMEAMMKFAQPGEHHKHLQALEGCWTASCKAWMGQKEPQVSEGRSANRMVLGGRFLEQRYESSFSGMPFSGIGMTGYDTYRKAYVATWADTFGTTITHYLGHCTNDGKTMVALGSYTNVATGKQAQQKNVTRVLGPDQHTFEMYDMGADGKWSKMMEITYTRHDCKGGCK